MAEFQVAVIASGSKGNATLFRYGNQVGLIDLGISCRKVVTAMAELGTCPQDLCGVFLTHEHIDHVRGLATFVKKYQVPVFATAGTWRGVETLLPELDWDSFEHRMMEPEMTLQDLQITSFTISHDANEPVGYTFSGKGHKFAYVTDTGFVTEQTKAAVQDAEVLVLEANHDLGMLKNGNYPQVLKKRIMGLKGHLNNTASAWLVAGLPPKPREVFLAHLSHENNTPSLALETFKEILSSQSALEEVKLYVTSQENITKNEEWEDFHEKDIFE